MKWSNETFPLLGKAIDPSHQANNSSANDEGDIWYSYQCFKCHCSLFFFKPRNADAPACLIMTAKEISLCWSEFRRKQILGAVCIDCREKHRPQWLLEAACGSLCVSGQTGRADESTWAAGKNRQWQLNLVILREEKRRN